MVSTNKRGFTLIELLASIAVLMLLVVMLGRIFGAAASTWRAGNKSIESNNSGRAAMEFMTRELGAVVASQGGPTIVLQSDRHNNIGMLSDAISFVSLSHVAERRSGSSYRDVQQVRYCVLPTSSTNKRYALYRFVKEIWNDSPDTFTAYESDDWIRNFDSQESNPGLYASILADNVRTFEVFITPVNQPGDDPQENYTYSPDNPPATIDIYLEVFAEDDALRASLTPNDVDFANRASRRYATRIFVQNRAGYATD